MRKSVRTRLSLGLSAMALALHLGFSKSAWASEKSNQDQKQNSNQLSEMDQVRQMILLGRDNIKKVLEGGPLTEHYQAMLFHAPDELIRLAKSKESAGAALPFGYELMAYFMNIENATYAKLACNALVTLYVRIGDQEMAEQIRLFGAMQIVELGSLH